MLKSLRNGWFVNSDCSGFPGDKATSLYEINQYICIDESVTRLRLEISGASEPMATLYVYPKRFDVWLEKDGFSLDISLHRSSNPCLFSGLREIPCRPKATIQNPFSGIILWILLTVICCAFWKLVDFLQKLLRPFLGLQWLRVSNFQP